jgi:hypothetical protein
MKLELGQIVRIKGDEDDNDYKVCGSDPTCNRFWLCVTNEEYDGYDGDLIVEVQGDKAVIVLCDSRCSFSHELRLTVVQ